MTPSPGRWVAAVALSSWFVVAHAKGHARARTLAVDADGGMRDVPLGGGAASPHEPPPWEEWGAPLPSDALVLRLEGQSVREGARPVGLAQLGARAAERTVLLDFDADTYLAQAAPVLTVLDASKAKVFLRGRRVSFPVRLVGQDAFRRWLDEPVPGKLRVVQRADGLELQTDLGKLPGPDRNGPSVPTRGGQLDIVTARHGLSLLVERFRGAQDACLVPSYGTELSRIVQALSAFYVAPGRAVVQTVCLVYPDAPVRDAGNWPVDPRPQPPPP